MYFAFFSGGGGFIYVEVSREGDVIVKTAGLVAA